MNAIVRIYVPRDSSWPGHYDLYIPDSITLGGVSYPSGVVLSYAKRCVDGVKTNNGSLYVFKPTDTKHVLKEAGGGNCRGYTISFSTTQAKINSLKNALASRIGGRVANTEYQHSVNAGDEFAVYNLNTINCFYATAKWCNALGNSMLLDIYEAMHARYGNSTAYQHYLPSTMFAEYGSAWDYGRTYTYNQNSGIFVETNEGL